MVDQFAHDFGALKTREELQAVLDEAKRDQKVIVLYEVGGVCFSMSEIRVNANTYIGTVDLGINTKITRPFVFNCNYWGDRWNYEFSLGDSNIEGGGYNFSGMFVNQADAARYIAFAKADPGIQAQIQARKEENDEWDRIYENFDDSYDYSFDDDEE